MISINMAKAIEIKKQKIRQDRRPLLEKLDLEFLRAVESNDINKQTEIAVKKQALRDATIDPVILNAQTPEELKNAVPAALKQ